MEGKLFDLVENNPRLSVEFCYCGIADYTISIFDHEPILGAEKKRIVYEQSCDRTLACANAYAKLAEYLSETRGGY